MTTKEKCLNQKTIATHYLGSAFTGLEIKSVEFGIDDYILFVQHEGNGEKTYHRRKIYYTNNDCFFYANRRRVSLSECIRTGAVL